MVLDQLDAEEGALFSQVVSLFKSGAAYKNWITKGTFEGYRWRPPHPRAQSSSNIQSTTKNFLPSKQSVGGSNPAEGVSQKPSPARESRVSG